MMLKPLLGLAWVLTLDIHVHVIAYIRMEAVVLTADTCMWNMVDLQHVYICTVPRSGLLAACLGHYQCEEATHWLGLRF